MPTTYSSDTEWAPEKLYFSRHNCYGNNKRTKEWIGLLLYIKTRPSHVLFYRAITSSVNRAGMQKFHISTFFKLVLFSQTQTFHWTAGKKSETYFFLSIISSHPLTNIETFIFCLASEINSLQLPLGSYCLMIKFMNLCRLAFS